MTAVWASHHEELCSDGVVAPHVFAHSIGPDLQMMLERYNPPGAAVDADLGAITHALQAERTADGGIVYVPQALHVSPRAPIINTQRGARFDHYCTRNCLPPKKLRQSIQ